MSLTLATALGTAMIGGVASATARGAAAAPGARPPVIATPSVPGAPTLDGVAAIDTAAVVTFTAPASDGGAAIDVYNVECFAPSIPDDRVVAAASGPITVTGLTNAALYECRVWAHNSVGDGPVSAWSIFVTPSATTSATLTAPADGANVAGDVALQATTSDPFALFYVDGRFEGSAVAVSAGVASSSWSSFGVTDGAHQVSVAGCDFSSCHAVSAVVSVTVTNGAAQLTNPSSGETLGSPTTLSATASGGGIQFLVDGQPVAFSAAAPYTARVSLPQGPHTGAVRRCGATSLTCRGETTTPVPFRVRVLHPVIVGASPLRFSPARDGRLDTTTITFSLPDTETVVWRVLRPADGATIRGPRSAGKLHVGQHTIVWDGRTNRGSAVPDGLYTVQLSTSLVLGGGEVARGTTSVIVRVDDTPLGLSGVTGARATFYPYPDGFADHWTPRVRVSGGIGTLYLDIFNPQHRLVRRLSTHVATSRTYSITWIGLTASHKSLPPGTYSFSFWTQDTAGNRRSTARYPVYVSGKRLVARSTVIRVNGNAYTALLGTTPSCMSASTGASTLPNGIWVANNCLTGQTEVLLAEYVVNAPNALRYTGVHLRVFGKSPQHTGERIAGAVVFAPTNRFVVGPVVRVNTPQSGGLIDLGSYASPGYISSGRRVDVAVVVPNLDGLEDLDIGTVEITVGYRVLQ